MRRLLSQTKLQLCENPNREPNRKPGVVFDQVFGRKTGDHSPAVEALVIGDRSEVAQRIAEAHQPFDVARVLLQQEQANSVILAGEMKLPLPFPPQKILKRNLA